MSDKSLQEQLKEFGLGDIESKIYLYLLNKEPQSILEISRNISIPRTSVYDSSLKLLEKGLIEREIGYKTQRIKAAPLDMFQQVIDKEKERLEKLENTYKHLEENISQVLIPNAATQVRYYHGAQGFQQMMWNTLSAAKEFIGYSVFGRVDIVGKKFDERWHHEVVTKKIRDRVITNPTPQILAYLQNQEETKKRAYQTTRFMDKSVIYISGDTTIYNNIFSVTYWKQGEVVGVEIENAELVKTQKSIFEQMWKLAKPFSYYSRKSSSREVSK